MWLLVGAALWMAVPLLAGQAGVPPAVPPTAGDQAKAADPLPGGPAPRKDQLRYGGKDFAAWQEALNDLKPEMRSEALKALGAFGVNGYADEAIAAIVGVLRTYDALENDPEENRVAAAAQDTLARIGPRSLAAIAKLQRGTLNDRRLAVQALRRALGKEHGKEAIALVLQAVRDEDAYVRTSALELFAGANRWSPESLQAATAADKRGLAKILDSLLGHENLLVREQAIVVLGWLGPEAKSAVPALIKIVEDRSSAPAPVGPGWGEGGRPGGKGGMPFPNPGGKGGGPTMLDLRFKAVQSLGSIGPDAAQAVPRLIKLMEDATEFAGLRLDAIEALGQMGPAAKEAVPALLRMPESVLDGDPAFSTPLSTREAVNKALKKIRH